MSTGAPRPLVWSRYLDERQGVETLRAYLSDGRVVAYDGSAWWQVCRLGSDAVRSLPEIVARSGIVGSNDLDRGDDDGGVDSAELTYGWRFGDDVHRVVNRMYPAQRHPQQQALEDELDRLEAGAEEPADPDDQPDITVDWDDPDGTVLPVLGDDVTPL